MNKKVLASICVTMCACVLLGLLAACVPSATGSADVKQQRRAYMSQVNETMAQLREDMVPFKDAVSRGDVVDMKAQAENAYKTLDKFAAIKPPEELAEVHQLYVDGTGKLREALDAYITLYTEIQGGSFDWSTYDKRKDEIQKLYDEGVQKLEAADKAAVDKDSEQSSGSSS